MSAPKNPPFCKILFFFFFEIFFKVSSRNDLLWRRNFLFWTDDKGDIALKYVLEHSHRHFRSPLSPSIVFLSFGLASRSMRNFWAYLFIDRGMFEEWSVKK